MAPYAWFPTSLGLRLRSLPFSDSHPSCHFTSAAPSPSSFNPSFRFCSPELFLPDHHSPQTLLRPPFFVLYHFSAAHGRCHIHVHVLRFSLKSSLCPARAWKYRGGTFPSRKGTSDNYTSSSCRFSPVHEFLPSATLAAGQP